MNIPRFTKSLLVMSLVATAILGLQIQPAIGDVPSVIQIEPWTSGADTLLNISCIHSSPSSSHYVDRIEVDIDGVIQVINLAEQSTVTFMVQYNMSKVKDTPSVRARAHCTLHGWSGWSSSVIIPEFPLLAIPIILVPLALAMFLIKSKFHQI